MFHRLTRIASLVLAFGFFISCSILNSSQQTSEPSNNLSEKEIQSRLDSLNKQLEEGNETAPLLYQRGKLLTELAKKKDKPTQRTSIYADAHESLSQASELYQNSSDTTFEKVQELLKVTWSNEHNKGVQILQKDTTTASPDYERAAANFENATAVIPDSAISYKMQARALYKDQQPQKAIEVLEKARRNVEDIPVKYLEQLAFLYLENDQPEKAIKVYEQAESFSDKNLNLLHGLSNAYINAKQHRKAAELLEMLSKNEPENVIYAQSLATELYFIAARQLESVVADLREGTQIKDTKFDSADSLLKRAKNHFVRIHDSNPKDQDLTLTVARFYQNSASKYQRLLPFVDSQKKEQLQNQIQEYLSSSIPLLEDLAKKSPDKERIWRKLYQAYTYLGMQEKAENAKSNF